MTEIYWITRLDAIRLLLSLISLGTGVLGAGFFIAYVISLSELDSPTETFRKTTITLVSIFTISIFSSVFIPSTKDMYMIYGIGGSIDYLKRNETAKQLPDKYIEFMDKWIDEKLKTEKQHP